MKIIIAKKLYPKLGIVNESIRYIENISLANSKWIHKNITMHSPIDVLVNFNDFIAKNIKLQNIQLEGLPKNVIPIIFISRNFQYHHHILESNTLKTYIINRYQLPLALVFCLTNFKAQGQTFNIDLRQSPNNVHLNMHHIYVTLSLLQSMDVLIILRNITMQNIRKVNFKIWSLEMLEPISKHNRTKNIQNNNPLKFTKN